MSAQEALNILCKWRTVFAGWQLGTRPVSDPESQAVRDHRDVTMILRAEVNALTQLLIKQGVFTKEEYDSEVAGEALLLELAYQKKFPGFRATNTGMVIDVQKAQETMRGWKP